MTIKKISRGLTFQGYISAVGSVIFVAGLIITISLISHSFSFAVCVLGTLMIITGIVLFLSIRGVLIDIDNRIIKPYIDIVIAKPGSWESLDKYDNIELKYKNESQTMNSRGNSTNYVTKSFDIVLTSNTEKDLIIKEFANYDAARSFLIVLSKELDMESIDTYEIIKSRIQERKQQVRR